MGETGLVLGQLPGEFPVCVRTLLKAWKTDEGDGTLILKRYIEAVILHTGDCICILEGSDAQTRNVLNRSPE